MLSFVLDFPIYSSIFAFVGALLPDLDVKPRNLHRKLFHNIWFLMIVLFVGFEILKILNRTTAIILSIGFISHLISDAATHTGIRPFWPFKKPRFNGPIRTGSFGEYLIVVILLVMIYFTAKFI